jgi:hypothetical protein
VSIYVTVQPPGPLSALDNKTFQFVTLDAAMDDLAKWSAKALCNILSIKEDKQSLDLRPIMLSIVRQKTIAAATPRNLPAVRRRNEGLMF